MRNDPRGNYVTPFRKPVMTMLEHPDLNHLDKLFLAWLVFAVDPGTRRLSGVTLTSLAEVHRTGRPQMRATLKRLEKVGYIRYEFYRRTDGWVELQTYDQIMNWTSWMANRRKRALAESAAQMERSGPTNPGCRSGAIQLNRENVVALLDSHGVPLDDCGVPSPSLPSTDLGRSA